MSRKLTKRQIKGITKTLEQNYIEKKLQRKKRKEEKAARRKQERHRSKKQHVEDLVEQELGDER